MIAIITIIILLTCVVLGFFVLVQNPKGGGLSGTFGSISSQVMGVKQSTDVMEKGTWASIGIIAGLSILSIMFASKPQVDNGNGKAPTTKSAPAKGTQAPK
jgi:preprotein translocase subunit SecG